MRVYPHICARSALRGWSGEDSKEFLYATRVTIILRKRIGASFANSYEQCHRMVCYLPGTLWYVILNAHRNYKQETQWLLVTNIEHFPRECDIFKKALKKAQGMFEIADVWHQKLRERKSLERSSVRLYWDPITEKRKRVEKAGEGGGIKRTKYQNWEANYLYCLSSPPSAYLIGGSAYCDHLVQSSPQRMLAQYKRIPRANFVDDLCF
jgi:hypothetical protein